MMMALSSCFCHPHFSPKIDYPRQAPTPCNINMDFRSTVSLKHSNAALLTQRVTKEGAILASEWSFVGGSKLDTRPRLPKFTAHRRGSSRVHASWWMNSQVASNVFTVGTVAVLPFYTLMVVAPKAELTKKSMQSSIPYFVLGVLYAYLLFLSWSPETLQLMFASKYWLPELPGIARMFSNEITLASAWIHLLAVDLFAARQVFHDGLENGIETRHSVSLCLLFCPVGIFTHFITKAFAMSARN